MSTLYVFRHAQASFGSDNYDALSDKGKIQAAHLATYLLDNHIRFDTLYIGPQVRHRQTAQPLISLFRERGIAHFEVVAIPELAEFDFGAVLATLVPLMVQEDKAWGEDADRMFADDRSFRRVFEAATLRWVAGDYPTSDFESWSEFTARVDRGLAKIMDRDGRGKHVALFTSGGPLAVTVRNALGLSDAMAMRLNWQVINTSLTRFNIDRNRLMLSSFNEHAWLMGNGKEGLVTYK